MPKKKTPQELQIQTCQSNAIGYMGAHLKAEKMMAKGLEQSRCATCSRFKWPDEKCALFVEEAPTGEGVK